MRALSYTMYRRSAVGDAVGDAVAGPNSPGEPLDFLAAHTFGGRKLYPGAAAFGLVASCETPGLSHWLSPTSLPQSRPSHFDSLTSVLSLSRVVTAPREDCSRPRVLGPSTRRINNSTTRVEAV